MTSSFWRQEAWARLKRAEPWDLAVIGGGATGLGIALDAALRGLSVVLFEAADFGSGTSSRATKLVHGGVRYLAQGNLGLVHEALHERALILANAPHVAQPLQFVVPAFRFWEGPYYGAGLKAYDALALGRRLGPTEFLTPSATQRAVPTVRRSGLYGAVSYWDGQFDDARLAVLLARTAAAQGACVFNHVQVDALRIQGSQLSGLTVRDRIHGDMWDVQARCIVNATGVWVDRIRALDPSHARSEGRPDGPQDGPPSMVKPSQGVHLVVDRSFLPGSRALMVPRTRDGRVLFAVPWFGKTILGTTDTPREDIVREPRPLASEVDFILKEMADYLYPAPRRSDVRSVWVGLRPLVKPAASGPTSALSREHTVVVDPSGLVTVTGGKWTTYRAMAHDVLAQCLARGLLPPRGNTPTDTRGGTASKALLGAPRPGMAPLKSLCEPPGEHLYGSEAAELRKLPGADHWLAFDAETRVGILSEAMVRFAVRYEMAQDVEDVLARRSRLLFLDARQAAAVAPAVAAILQEELGPEFDAPASLASFQALAAQYATLP